MQTYTHLLIGAAVGALLYPNQALAPAAFTAGSIAPDIALIPLFVYDKIRHKQALADQDQFTMIAKEISHSLPITAILAVILSQSNDDFIKLLAIFFAGMALHIMIDSLTHCGERFRDTDQSCVWPIPGLKLGAWVGLWEYRYDHGVLKPKPLEAIVCGMAALVTIIALIVPRIS